LQETKYSDVSSRKADKNQEPNKNIIDDIPDETYTNKYRNKQISHSDLLDKEISIYELKEQKNSLPNMASPQDSYTGNNGKSMVVSKKEVRNVSKE
jgi:hypothetical protein